MKKFITINGRTIPADTLRIMDYGTAIAVFDTPLSVYSSNHSPLFKTHDPDEMAALRWWIAQNSEDILTAEERWAATNTRLNTFMERYFMEGDSAVAGETPSGVLAEAPEAPNGNDTDNA